MLMKKETKTGNKINNTANDEQRTINTITEDTQTGQPVPQPKDYDEIEY